VELGPGTLRIAQIQEVEDRATRAATLAVAVAVSVRVGERGGPRGYDREGWEGVDLVQARGEGCCVLFVGFLQEAG